MKYWVNLYTWKTWQEYVQAGGKVSGFRESRWRTVQRIKPGDLLLCYMTGISRFFAILEVTGTPYKDDTQIWEETLFPCRLPVRTILALEPGYAVPVVDLRSQLSYFQDLKTPHAWSGHFRGSPTEEKPQDAEIIIEALRQAEQEPYFQEFDQRKLERKVPVFETKTGSVSIPENEDDQPTPITGGDTGADTSSVTHEEIQWLLLHIGQQMGLGLWVARNDQNRSFEGQEFQGFSRLRQSLPIQYDAATNRTIELIDVLWLDGNSIVAAFEIEHTTAIYSGLLRMADLITMQPNINIPLFIVAPDERREKVEHEINRPIFSKALKQPLPEICRYIAYSALREKVEQAEIGGFLRYLRPDFLDEIAESVELDEF